MTDMAESMHMAIKVSQTSGGAFLGGMKDLYERTRYTFDVSDSSKPLSIRGLGIRNAFGVSKHLKSVQSSTQCP